LGLSVNVKTFDEVPLADVKVDVKSQKNMVDIIFPQSYANQQIQLLIHDEVFSAKADPQATLTIKKKNIINLIQKK
jgi:hypothetical protein